MQRQQHKLTIDGPVGPLEAELSVLEAQPLPSWMAVVCHPHPSHGGTMNNKVVTTLVRTFVDLGMPTMRFNFRGVGGSAGHYDQGAGEQQDLAAVVEAMCMRYPDARLALAGFSFGANIAWQYTVAHNESLVRALTLVAPPISRMAFSPTRITCPLCVIQGDEDEIVDPRAVTQWFQALPVDAKQLIRLGQASHFFHGQLVLLKDKLTEQIKPVLNA